MESLANRLHLTTQLPDTTNHSEKNGSIRSLRSTSSRRSKLSDGGFDNPVFHPQESTPIEGFMYPTMNAMGSSENEFNASIFGLNPSLYIGPSPIPCTESTYKGDINNYCLDVIITILLFLIYLHSKARSIITRS